MQFLKNILSTLLALIIFSLAAVFIGILILTAMSQDEPVKVPEAAVLSLSLSKPITELQYEDPLSELGFSSKPNSIGLIQLLNTLDMAKNDDRIKGIYLQAPYLMGGFAAGEEIRDALLDFKESGKFIVSYANNYSEGGYYISSVSDRVLMHPEGHFELNGISSSVIFFKGLLDKLDIEAEIFRVGDYKSAIEPFERTEMSDENREQLLDLISHLNNHLLTNIARDRNIERDRIEEISRGMEVRFPEDAVELGLVDELMYKDELKQLFRELMELEDSQDPELIGYSEYSTTYSGYKKTKDEVRVIVAVGDIVEGGSSDMIDGTRFANMVRDAREDDRVKAIVLRVNSLGGQLQASDLIWREVKLAADTKPVIASFSDYATSGGYYIAMEADTIIASPNSITGSIGIFGMLFNFGPMMENKLGITWDEVSTGEYSGMYTFNRSLSENERAIIQNDMQRGYDNFTRKVAEGRGKEVEEIIEIAGGRVWSGEQALENGLIDRLGGLRDAIEIAAKTAGIEDYRIRYLPKQKTIFEELMDSGDGAKEEVLSRELGEHYSVYQRLKNIVKYQGLQARSPWEVSFE